MTNVNVEFAVVYRAIATGVHSNTVRVTANEYDRIPANDIFVRMLTVN